MSKILTYINFIGNGIATAGMKIWKKHYRNMLQVNKINRAKKNANEIYIGP